MNLGKIQIRKFSNEEDLLEKIHKTGFGLSSSIFGKNKKRMNEIIKNLKTGTVSINDVMTHYGISSIPFGGEGVSGIGRLHGKEGLRSFSRTKSIVVNRFNFMNEIWWFGRSEKINTWIDCLDSCNIRGMWVHQGQFACGSAMC